MAQWLVQSVVSESPCQHSKLGPVLISYSTWGKILLLFRTPVCTRGMAHSTIMWVNLQCQVWNMCPVNCPIPALFTEGGSQC